MAIGGLLGCVATFLVQKNREMLVGRSVPRRTLDRVEKALLDDDVVRAVYSGKGVVMGSDQVRSPLFTCSKNDPRKLIAMLLSLLLFTHTQVRFSAEIQFNGWKLTEKFLKDYNPDLKLAHARLRTPEDVETFLCLFGDDIVDALSDEVRMWSTDS